MENDNFWAQTLIAAGASPVLLLVVKLASNYLTSRKKLKMDGSVSDFKFLMTQNAELDGQVMKYLKENEALRAENNDKDARILIYKFENNVLKRWAKSIIAIFNARNEQYPSLGDILEDKNGKET